MVQISNNASFKYVTIEPDDDELVIVAGARRVDGQEPAQALRESGGPSNPEDAELADRAEPCEPAESAELPQPTAADKRDESTQPAAAGGRDEYRETTLDDLGHEPMPKMQRAVLVAIGVLVVVFVAYVLFF